MLKTNWTSAEKITFTQLNALIDDFSNMRLSIIGIDFLYTPYSIGKFWFSEDLENFESAINELAISLNIPYIKKDWYNLTDISYKDINRWSSMINSVSETLFFLLYTSTNTYASSNTYMTK